MNIVTTTVSQDSNASRSRQRRTSPSRTLYFCNLCFGSLSRITGSSCQSRVYSFTSFPITSFAAFFKVSMFESGGMKTSVKCSLLLSVRRNTIYPYIGGSPRSIIIRNPPSANPNRVNFV